MSRRFANQFKRLKPSLQARIDWSHPAAPDLLCCPFSELAGPPRDLCRHANASVSGTAPTWVSARADYSGAGYHSFGDVDWFDGLSAFTIAAMVRVDTYSAAMGLLNKRAAFNSENAFSVGWRYSAVDGYFTCGVGATTAEANKYSFQSGSPGGWNLWLAAYDSAASAGSRWRLWINAAEIAPLVENDGNGAVPNTTAPVIIGAVNSGSPLYFDGAIDWLYAWRGVRSDLILPLLTDPYQFLDDGPRRVYYVPVAAAPGSRNGNFNIALA